MMWYVMEKNLIHGQWIEVCYLTVSSKLARNCYWLTVVVLVLERDVVFRFFLYEKTTNVLKWKYCNKMIISIFQDWEYCWGWEILQKYFGPQWQIGTRDWTWKRQSQKMSVEVTHTFNYNTTARISRIGYIHIQIFKFIIFTARNMRNA